MSPERAAEVLGVTADASPLDVEHAFQRRARATHPDVADPGSASAARGGFHEAAEARRVLLGSRASSTAAADPGMRRVVAGGPRPQGPGLVAVWAGLLLVAAFLAIFRASYPFTVGEPLVRWALLIGGSVGFALTGRRGLVVVAVVAELATVAMTVAFTTFGGLLALLITLPALLGAFTAGIVRFRLRAVLLAAVR